jgi:hypothetical protein
VELIAECATSVVQVGLSNFDAVPLLPERQTATHLRPLAPLHTREIAGSKYAAPILRKPRQRGASVSAQPTPPALTLPSAPPLRVCRQIKRPQCQSCGADGGWCPLGAVGFREGGGLTRIKPVFADLAGLCRPSPSRTRRRDLIGAWHRPH